MKNKTEIIIGKIYKILVNSAFAKKNRYLLICDIENDWVEAMTANGKKRFRLILLQLNTEKIF